MRAIIVIASATWISLCGETAADAIYLKERVVNSAQPGASQTAFPSARLAAYQNSVGLPLACEVASRYPKEFPGIDCRSGSAHPPPMQKALYPAAMAPLSGALFSKPEDRTLDATGAYAEYWNLLYSSDSPGYVFVDRNRYLQFALLARHFGDNPNVGAYVTNDYKVYYRVSTDGGRSFPTGQQFQPVIASGQTVMQPFPTSRVGRDGAAIPGTAYIGKGATGDVLATLSITEGPVPAHVSSFTNGYVLRGKWNPAGNDVIWSISEPAKLSASLSTRGVAEPAVMELPSSVSGGANCFLLVRASNENYSKPTHSEPSIAGHYWLFRSTDGCATWHGKPIRWGYSDGTPFYAPASNSILFRSPRNNRIYWIGSISASNSQGNWPRTRFVAAEVDVQSDTPGIVKDSLTVLDQMQGPDTDRVQINNAQLAMQPDGSAFVFLRRGDGGCPTCTSPYSWYTIDIATQAGVDLSATTVGDTSHVISWKSGLSNVSQYHVRRRYLSGDPLGEAWVQVATVPGANKQLTIENQQPWQEAEYEVIAELASGASYKSNRVIARFPSWQGPRLSFSFPSERSPGAEVPLGSVAVTWTYDRSRDVRRYRLYRRSIADKGSVTKWEFLRDLDRNSSRVVLTGYEQSDRFELRVAAVDQNSRESLSNTVNVRFPTAGDPLRPPY